MLGWNDDHAAVLTRLRVPLEAVSAAPSAPDLSSYAFDERAAARLAWINRVLDEYRSAVLFSELLCLLGDLGAALPVLGAVQHVVADELRHARLTETVVSWLGGADDMEIDKSGFRPTPSDSPTIMRALALCGRELMVAEETALPVHRAYVAACEEPSIRRVLTILVKDEATHAAVGRAVYEPLVVRARAEGHDRACDELSDELEAYAQQLTSYYRDSSQGGPGRTLGACISAADLRG